MKLKVKVEEHLRLVSYGKQLLILKFKQELLICFTKTRAIENQINKI
jgi:hypothetical protein